MGKVLITGALGQIGTELTEELANRKGPESILATDVREGKTFKSAVLFEQLDVTNKDRLEELLEKYQVSEIYHLASILSATGEQNPDLAWDVNMRGLLNVLNLSVKHKIEKVFWPSSIAAFGSTTPRINTPQQTVTEPDTIYGITKVAGEGWCNYFSKKHNLDVRSIRYPGLISYKTLPGGGTTDYAVDIYHKAAQGETFQCFLNANTALPMMYMDDAIRGTLELMEAPSEKISIRTSYNFAAMSFTPEAIYQAIQKVKPDFKIRYNPDFRQAIANTWPQSIDDSVARKDWNWQHQFDLDAMTADMLQHIEMAMS